MQLPPGFTFATPGTVCRLRKSLYGLRQVPQNWFAKLSTALKDLGFIQSYGDYSLFRYSKGDVALHVLVYVDDIIITGSFSLEITYFKQQLSKRFHMKDLGVLKYFLGIEVAHGKDGLFLSQRKYVLDIVSEVDCLKTAQFQHPWNKTTIFPQQMGPPIGIQRSIAVLLGALST